MSEQYEVREVLQQTTVAINREFNHTLQYFREIGATVVMPTFFPQRGNLVKLAARSGVRSIILGGAEGEQEFPEVEQYGVNGLAAGTATESFEEAVQVCANLPANATNLVVFEYDPHDYSWADLLDTMHQNLNIVAEATGHLFPVLENKVHLTDMLYMAGLEQYVIPNELITGSLGFTDAEDIFWGLVGDDIQKVVVQPCGEGMTDIGGGKTTVICDTVEELAEILRVNDGTLKVSKYIDGQETNISWYAGNTVPSENGFGTTKVTLPDGVSPHDPNILNILLNRAAQAGIHEDNTLVIPGRATVKAVGDPTLTNSEGNGVGNNLGYVYPEPINAQLEEVIFNLGGLTALMGKNGLQGVDGIIDKNGKLWINEMNDRQQGPTSTMSIDAEMTGIPPIDKIAWLAHFADHRNPDVARLFADLRSQEVDIFDAAVTNPHGSFYLKFNSKHDERIGALPLHNPISQGIHIVYYDEEQGRFIWSPTSHDLRRVGVNSAPMRGRQIAVRIEGPDHNVGDRIIPGRQLFRITGVSNTADASPIIIDRGKSIVNPNWSKALRDLYEYLFGIGYNELNPLEYE
ncbi:hypothetical protein KC909_02730 [Candidatus Dojkabacteria bacterium]|uniref:ATP-grasp domain-containing protein n=1 Tax=Candidatus Dojkabacteria bacterium TaxID=2099670 RepID=A0A955L5Z0_9BACT|nr:hypothetical protein [Candidatus Dojkabacteria bacterium]